VAFLVEIDYFSKSEFCEQQLSFYSTINSKPVTDIDSQKTTPCMLLYDGFIYEAASM
jgi:hypothetical protein